TEFLAALAGGVDVAMMLACPELRVVPVTIHLSLADAVRTLESTPADGLDREIDEAMTHTRPERG
ncbi:MAG: 4-hydroxythreonine-4-phosphate dehydrogenase PdxA, partial [Burkholderiales bacterium]